MTSFLYGAGAYVSNRSQGGYRGNIREERPDDISGSGPPTSYAPFTLFIAWISSHVNVVNNSLTLFYVFLITQLSSALHINCTETFVSDTHRLNFHFWTYYGWIDVECSPRIYTVRSILYTVIFPAITEKQCVRQRCLNLKANHQCATTW